MGADPGERLCDRRASVSGLEPPAQGSSSRHVPCKSASVQGMTRYTNICTICAMAKQWKQCECPELNKWQQLVPTSSSSWRPAR